MILTVLFVLVLLIGLSLFIAVVGTALLRRNTRSAGHSYYSTPGRVMYREQPGRMPEYVYQDRGAKPERSGTAQRGAPPPQGYTPIEPASFGPPPLEPGEFEPRPYTVSGERSPGVEGKWFAISIVVLIVMFFAVFFGVRVYQSATSRPKIDFCEYVDFVKMKPVNPSVMFTRGNVTLFLRSGAPLEIDKMRIEIYRIDRDGIVPYSSSEKQLKPDWTSFSVKILFEQLGTYTVMLYTNAGALLGQKTIVIVPDSYVFAPVQG
jgi:hypothetical protein